MEVTSVPGVRLFTASEANDLVPALQISFAAIGQMRTEIETLLGGLAEGDPDQVVEILRGETDAPPEQEQAVGRLQVLILELGQAVEGVASLGVIIHDLEPGLVDLPSMREGKVTMLCWQFGEPYISYFHGVDEGFEQRRPLPDSPPMWQ